MIERGGRRSSALAVSAGLLLLVSALVPAHMAHAQTAIGFGKSTLSGETSSGITAMQFGPDGKLYVGQFNGLLKVYSVTRNGANSYSVTNTQTLTSIQSTTNHNDNGQVNSSVNTRLITGLLVAGTASNPVVYVTHSDPRIGGGSSGTDTGLDTNSSMISRLTWTGSSWSKLDLVRGLPRSEENHAANGMALSGSTLYVAMGGNTNKGAPSNNFALLPEFALSAAILKVNLSAIGNSTYDLPTLNDENRSGNPDANDPFGGNNGKNQAILVPNGPVGVHAPGFRNPYDLVITQSGKMYTIDNGGNSGWGEVPVNEGPQGTCTNQRNEPGTTDPDALHLVTSGYYGGHPNPTRGNKNNTFNGSNPQSPVSSSNPVECDYRKAGTSASTALTTFPGSTNGITEYTTNNFGGQLQGNLLAAGYNKNTIYRIQLNSAGTSVVSNQALFSNVGSKPLPVTAQKAGGPFPGTVWVGDQGNGNIYVLEPNDYGGGGGPSCTGNYSWNLDEDDDGYKNADEIDNGTNPCSSADVPPDWDKDGLSNLNDPDDDNDGIPDTRDPFAIDPNNGTTTTMPVSYTWDNDAPNPGGLLNLGFTGLMTNGKTNYEKLFDPDKMTAGGAAGVTTVDEVAEGDAIGRRNTQKYGFQFGVVPTRRFTTHTQILGPFAGLQPQNFQSMGLFIGNGRQSDYLKIVVAARGGKGGIEVVKEVGDQVKVRRMRAVSLPGPARIDLFLKVDRASGKVRAAYRVLTGGKRTERMRVGTPISIPKRWYQRDGAIAVGIISTSRGDGPPFPATWGFMKVHRSKQR